LFKKDGVSDEEAASVRNATAVVWQLMVDPLDQAISSGAAVVYGRTPNVSAPLKRVPPDVWPHLRIVDWQNGIAKSDSGPVYFSIHVDVIEPVKSALAQPKKQLSRVDLRKEVRGVYDDEEKRIGKVPNQVELPKLLMARLRFRGLRASRESIQEVAREKEFAHRRLKRGEKAPKSPSK
jgi:hypothetical protein